MFKYLILGLLFIGCSKTADLKPQLIKFINDQYKIDSELWYVKIISTEEISETKKNNSSEICRKKDVVFSINLKENCFESKDFLDENIITAQIKKAFNPGEKIYTFGKCYTTKDIDKNLTDWKAEQLKLVGTKKCVSHRHILVGGGCEKEVGVTADLVEEDFNNMKNKALSDLSSQTVHSVGESHLEKIMVNHCQNSEGEFSISLGE